MAEHPGFGVLLARLAARRGLGIRALAEEAAVSEAELRPVFDGAAPSPALLHRLAPVLAQRVPDLFVLAGLEPPPEWAPLDPMAGGRVPWIAMRSRELSPERRGELLAFARALPQETRTRPERTQGRRTPPERYAPDFGAMLVRMLAHRNLTWAGAAKALYAVSGTYLSAATVGQVGRGRKELTPELLVAFANALGVAAADLAALTGIDLPDGPPPHDPAVADAAELIWEARRLRCDQVAEVRARLEALLEA
ncbi:hypothetical protein [Streptomyces sp. AC555_RSS877]|uniref:hypothetical protein n=1 Tax=Streptomyces sp. AC555_RSS877 TaxID=2823688 RepID=UPI001C268653|nr:hypothetical protein [Streptomyces sp. AC555_RSS877]